MNDNIYFYKLTMGETNKYYHKKIPYWSWILIHCPNCETEWEPAYRLWWHTWINIILLVLWIIPWIFYFIRRCMNCVCLCKNCHHEELWEINWDTELIKKLKKIQRKQNIYYLFIVIVFLLIILDIIIRLN